MADVLLDSSPLAPGRSPVRIHYRDTGDGPPIVILHGGWGYDAYPFDHQIAALASRHRFVIPDRTGYGRSEPIDTLATNFHQSAAGETLAVIEALHLDRPILWGHSDGAIVALLIGLQAPDGIAGTIVEATHYFRHSPPARSAVVAKPRVLDAFTDDPDRRRVGSWRRLLRRASIRAARSRAARPRRPRSADGAGRVRGAARRSSDCSVSDASAPGGRP
jgi:pimeloyl-ACP methyl ester carboxylesterase